MAIGITGGAQQGGVTLLSGSAVTAGYSCPASSNYLMLVITVMANGSAPTNFTASYGAQTFTNLAPLSTYLNTYAAGGLYIGILPNPVTGTAYAPGVTFGASTSINYSATLISYSGVDLTRSSFRDNTFTLIPGLDAFGINFATIPASTVTLLSVTQGADNSTFLQGIYTAGASSASGFVAPTFGSPTGACSNIYRQTNNVNTVIATTYDPTQPLSYGTYTSGGTITDGVVAGTGGYGGIVFYAGTQVLKHDIQQYFYASDPPERLNLTQNNFGVLPGRASIVPTYGPAMREGKIYSVEMPDENRLNGFFATANKISQGTPIVNTVKQTSIHGGIHPEDYFKNAPQPFEPGQEPIIGITGTQHRNHWKFDFGRRSK